MVNSILAICIPTFNRADVLDEVLERLIRQISKHRIGIYISDNASDDNTGAVVKRHKKNYSYIYYRRNSQTTEADYNFIAVLQMPRSKYRWLFGDYTLLDDGSIDKIMPMLRGSLYSAVILNEKKRVLGLPSAEYKDRNRFLVDLGWHITSLRTMIYRRDVVETEDWTRYAGSYFIQSGLLLDHIAKGAFSIYWMSDPILDYSRKKKISGWIPEFIEYFVSRWPAFVLSLPGAYSLDSKLQCIKAHNSNANIFKIRNLLKFRVEGYFGVFTLLRYRRLIPIALPLKKRLNLFFVAMIPVWVLNIVRRIVRFYRRNKQQI